MTVALLQAYLSPPQERAKRHMMAVQAKMAKPGRSKEWRMAGRPCLISEVGRRSGTWMKKRETITRAPMGRLI